MFNETHKLFLELFLDEYPLWLRKNSSVKEGNNGWFELTTPYLDCHNDYIVVYAKQEKGVITIANDGELLKWTEPKSVDKILNTYGVKVLNGELYNKSDTELEVIARELYVDCNESDFVQKLHNLISAIIEINALKYATTN